MSFDLLTSHVVINLILHGHSSTTTVGGLIFHRLAMPEESEPEMSAHKIVVRSSNHPDHTALHAHLCFRQSTNLIHATQLVQNGVCVAYSPILAMVLKALRPVF